MHFDPRAAKLLQPGQHLLVEGCPGLRLEATASRRAWTYRYKAADGRMKQIKLGLWPDIKAPEAVAAWKEKSAQRAAGVDPVQAKREGCAELRAQARGEGAAATVESVVRAYIKGPLHDGRGTPARLAAERALLRLLAEAPELASTPAAQLTRAQAFAALDVRKAHPTAAAKLRGLLGAAWEHAHDSGAVTDAPNWWREVMRGKLKSKGKILGGQHVGRQRRVLPAAEVAALLGWLRNMHTLARDGVLMYLWTATRGVEIFGARPEHLRLSADGVLWWTIPKAATKNARFADAVDLRVPLFGRAREIMARRLAAAGERKDSSGWLFEDVRGGQYTQHDLSTYIYDLQPHSVKAQARPGRAVLPVAGWTPHHLRKTARTFLAELGCPNEVGEAILGHLPAEIVGTYNAYSYDAERVHWLGKLAVFLEALVPADSGLPALP